MSELGGLPCVSVGKTDRGTVHEVIITATVIIIIIIKDGVSRLILVVVTEAILHHIVTCQRHYPGYTRIVRSTIKGYSRQGWLWGGEGMVRKKVVGIRDVGG